MLQLHAQSCQVTAGAFADPIVTVTLSSVTDQGGGNCLYDFIVQISNSSLIINSQVNFVPSSGTAQTFNATGNSNFTVTRNLTGACSGISGTLTLTKIGALSGTNYGSCSFTITSSLLPVELTTFSASPQKDGQVALNWTTLTEVNNDGFEIQRSYDALDWEFISFVRGQGTITQPTDYTYLDQLPSGTDEVYYRLKQMDHDGAFEFSSVINVQIESASLHLLNIYPNPAHDGLNIVSDQGQATIFSLTGQSLRQLQLQKGTTHLNIEDLPAGSFLLQVELESGERLSRKFVKWR